MIRELRRESYDGELDFVELACDDGDTTPTDNRPVTGIITGSKCHVVNATPPRIDAFSEESGAWVLQMELGS